MGIFDGKSVEAENNELKQTVHLLWRALHEQMTASSQHNRTLAKIALEVSAPTFDQIPYDGQSDVYKNYLKTIREETK